MNNNKHKLLILSHLLDDYKNNFCKFEFKQIFRALFCYFCIFLSCLPTLAVGLQKSSEEILHTELRYDSRQAINKTFFENSRKDSEPLLISQTTPSTNSFPIQAPDSQNTQIAGFIEDSLILDIANDSFNSNFPLTGVIPKTELIKAGSVELFLKSVSPNQHGEIRILHKTEQSNLTPSNKGFLIGYKDSKFWWHLGDGTNTLDVLSNAYVKDNEWTHIVGTWDASTHTISLYINGNQEKTLIDTNNISNISTSVPIAVDKNFTGSIARIRIYNRSLTPDEVQQNLKSILTDIPWQGSNGNLIADITNCSVNKNCPGKTCTKDSDCSSTEKCTDGFCVVPQLPVAPQPPVIPPPPLVIPPRQPVLCEALGGICTISRETDVLNPIVPNQTITLSCPGNGKIVSSDSIVECPQIDVPFGNCTIGQNECTINFTLDGARTAFAQRQNIPIVEFPTTKGRLSIQCGNCDSCPPENTILTSIDALIDDLSKIIRTGLAKYAPHNQNDLFHEIIDDRPSIEPPCSKCLSHCVDAGVPVVTREIVTQIHEPTIIQNPDGSIRLPHEDSKYYFYINKNDLTQKDKYIVANNIYVVFNASDIPLEAPNKEELLRKEHKLIFNGTVNGQSKYFTDDPANKEVNLVANNAALTSINVSQVFAGNGPFAALEENYTGNIPKQIEIARQIIEELRKTKSWTEILHTGAQNQILNCNIGKLVTNSYLGFTFYNGGDTTKIARPLKEIYNPRDYFIFNKIIYIPKEEIAIEDRPPNDYFIFVNSDFNGKYFYFPAGGGEIELQDGSFFTDPNDKNTIYNAPNSEIEWINHIGMLRGQINSSSNNEQVQFRLNLIRQLRGRHEALTRDIRVLERIENRLTPFEQNELFLARRRKESIETAFNEEIQPVEEYIREQRLVIANLRDPVQVSEENRKLSLMFAELTLDPQERLRRLNVAYEHEQARLSRERLEAETERVRGELERIVPAIEQRVRDLEARVDYVTNADVPLDRDILNELDRLRGRLYLEIESNLRNISDTTGGFEFYRNRVESHYDTLHNLTRRLEVVRRNLEGLGILPITNIFRSWRVIDTDEQTSIKAVRNWGGDNIRRLDAKIKLIQKLKDLNSTELQNAINDLTYDVIPRSAGGPNCGNRVRDAGEECDPPGDEPACGFGAGGSGVCKEDCTCEATLPLLPPGTPKTLIIEALGSDFNQINNMTLPEFAERLANYNTRYRIEPQELLLFGDLYGLLIRKKQLIEGEVRVLAEQIKSKKEEQDQALNALTSRGRYGFWSDLGRAIVQYGTLTSGFINWGPTQGEVIAEEDRQSVNRIATLNTEIETLKGKIGNRIIIINALEKAQYVYEYSLNTNLANDTIASTIVVAAALKYGPDVRAIYSEFPTLSSALSHLTLLDEYSNRFLLRSTGGGNTEAELNFAMEVAYRLATNGQANNFFENLQAKLNAVKEQCPFLPLPALFEGADYEGLDQTAKASIYTLKRTSTYIKFLDELQQINEPISRFSAVAKTIQEYRSPDVVNFARQSVIALNERISAINRIDQGAFIRDAKRLINLLPSNCFSNDRYTTDDIWIYRQVSGTPPTERPGTRRYIVDKNPLGADSSNRTISVTVMLNTETGTTTEPTERIPGRAFDTYEEAADFVSRRQKPFEKILSFLTTVDTNIANTSYTARNFRETLALILDTARYNDTTWPTWWRTDGIKSAVTIIAATVVVVLGCATIVACGPTVSGLIAVSALGALGGVVSYQLISEILYHVYQNNPDVRNGNLTYSERSYLGRWLADIERGPPPGSVGDLFTLARTFTTDVVWPLGKDFAVSFAITFATIGIGQQLGAGISRVLQNSRLVQSLLRTHPQTVTGLSAAEAHAARAASHSLARQCSTEVLQEFAEEVIENLIEKAVPFIGDGSGIIVVAIQGIRPRRAPNGNILARNYVYDPQAQAVLASQLRSLGFITTVGTVGNANGVITATHNGNTFTYYPALIADDTTSTVSPTDANINTAILSARESILSTPGVTINDGLIVIPGGTTITLNSLHGLTISTPQNLNLAIADWEFDNLVKLLNEKVPAHIRQFLYPHIRMSLGDTGQAGRLGDFNNATLDVRLFTDFSSESFNTILHEMGHLFDRLLNGNLFSDRTWSDATKAKWNELVERVNARFGDSPESRRYLSSPHEIYAECFRLFILAESGEVIPWTNFDSTNPNHVRIAGNFGSQLSLLQDFYNQLEPQFQNPNLTTEAISLLNNLRVKRDSLNQHFNTAILQQLNTLSDLDINARANSIAEIRAGLEQWVSQNSNNNSYFQEELSQHANNLLNTNLTNLGINPNQNIDETVPRLDPALQENIELIRSLLREEINDVPVVQTLRQLRELRTEARALTPAVDITQIDEYHRIGNEIFRRNFNANGELIGGLNGNANPTEAIRALVREVVELGIRCSRQLPQSVTLRTILYDGAMVTIPTEAQQETGRTAVLNRIRTELQRMGYSATATDNIILSIRLEPPDVNGYGSEQFGYYNEVDGLRITFRFDPPHNQRSETTIEQYHYHYNLNISNLDSTLDEIVIIYNHRGVIVP